MHSCIVSFVDSEGLRHSVEVEAESLYEAAVLGIRVFRLHGCAPGIASRVEVEIRTAVTHTVTVQKVEDWVLGGAKNPKEAALKHRLKQLLNGSSL